MNALDDIRVVVGSPGERRRFGREEGWKMMDLLSSSSESCKVRAGVSPTSSKSLALNDTFNNFSLPCFWPVGRRKVKIKQPHYTTHNEKLSTGFHLSSIFYRVIRKSLRDFQPLRYSSRNGHAEGQHVNRGRDTPSFCPTLQVLDISTLGDAADVNPVIKLLPHSATCVAGVWLQDWHLPRHQGLTYRAPVR